MTWTSERPRRKGFYWFRGTPKAFPYNGIMTMVEVVRDAGFRTIGYKMIGSEVQLDGRDMKDALWWGPIEPPA